MSEPKVELREEVEKFGPLVFYDLWYHNQILYSFLICFIHHWKKEREKE